MHDLLDDLAPEVDVDTAWEEVRSRLSARPTGRAAKVLAVAAAIALVAGGAVLATRGGSGDDAGPSAPATTTPTNIVRDDVHGVEITLPAGWQTARTILTPHLGDAPDRPWEVSAVGTYPLTPNGPGARCAHMPVAALNQLGPTDALVWVHSPTGFRGFDPRPERFTDLDAERPGVSDLTECIARPADFLAGGASFREGGLNLTVSVFLGLEASAETRAQALDVLNSTRVSPDTTPQTEEVAGLTISHPGDWQVAGQLTDQLTEGPVQTAAVGTYELRHDPPCPTAECRPECADWPAAAVEDLGPDDVLVWWAEMPPELAAAAWVPERRFYDRLPTAGLDSPCDSVDRTARLVGLRDGSWVGAVYVLVGPEASEQRQGQALDILNSFVVVGPAVTLDAPEGWEVAGQLTTQEPDETDLQVAAAGTVALRPDDEAIDCDHWPVRAANAMAPDDALVWIVQSQDPEFNPSVPPFERFDEIGGEGWGRAGTCPAVDDRAQYTAFQMGGRAHVVYVLLGDAVSRSTRREALDTINSLTFT